MKQEFSPQIPDFQQIRERLFKIAEDGGGGFFYSEIRQEINSLIVNGFEKQAKDIAIDIMKSYTYRPALIWEIKQILIDYEIADFDNWHKTAKSNKPKMKYSKCDSIKIARILYDVHMFDENSKNSLTTEQ